VLRCGLLFAQFLPLGAVGSAHSSAVSVAGRMKKLVVVILLLGIVAGAVAFWAIEPTIGGGHFLRPTELLTAASEPPAVGASPFSPSEPPEAEAGDGKR
jgi:hypothetical protein